jgi:hypothetical protein
LFNKTREQVHFYFLFGPDGDRYLANCNLNTKSCRVYSHLLIGEGSRPVPPPLGMVGEFYAVMLYPWQIGKLLNGMPDLNYDWQHALQQAGKGENPVLLLFRV